MTLQLDTTMPILHLTFTMQLSLQESNQIPVLTRHQFINMAKLQCHASHKANKYMKMNLSLWVQITSKLPSSMEVQTFIVYSNEEDKKIQVT